MGLFAGLLGSAAELFGEALGDAFLGGGGGGFNGTGLEETIASIEEKLSKVKEANSKIILPETLNKSSVADERKQILDVEGLYNVPAQDYYYEVDNMPIINEYQREGTFYNNIFAIYDDGKDIEDRINEKLDELKSLNEQILSIANSNNDLASPKMPNIGIGDVLSAYSSKNFSQLNGMANALSGYISDLEATDEANSIGGSLDQTYVDSLYSQAESIVGEIQEILLEYNKIDANFVAIATSLEKFLHEETSDLELAKLWQAKMDKLIEHDVHPEEGKGQDKQYKNVDNSMSTTTSSTGTYDEVLSQVMEAYRNWSSVMQYQVDLYGSQNLINSTYESVLSGHDAMASMYEIIDINYRDYMAKKAGYSINEESKTLIPYARGLFGTATGAPAGFTVVW